MLKNVLRYDVIYSNHTCRKLSLLCLWSGQIFSWHAPLASGSWSGTKERLNHLPGYTRAQRNKASPEYQTWLKPPKPWQKPWRRGNARVGSAQMARKGTRAGCQRLKSNLSLLGPHTPPRCQQNRQMQTAGTHKVGDGSLSQTSSGACHSYLTNANPPLFSCMWGRLSMQRVCTQILCAQTEPSPFEVLALIASGSCCNACSLGLRGSEGGESFSVAPRSTGDFHRAARSLYIKQSLHMGFAAHCSKPGSKQALLWSHDCHGLRAACSHLQAEKNLWIRDKT